MTTAETSAPERLATANASDAGVSAAVALNRAPTEPATG